MSVLLWTWCGPPTSDNYEVAIIVSQDWDFGPAVRLAKEIAKAQDRRLVFECCFPLGPGGHSRRGVPGRPGFR